MSSQNWWPVVASYLVQGLKSKFVPGPDVCRLLITIAN